MGADRDVLKTAHELIVVMPVYEDRESASLLLRDLARACPAAPFIVAVEDGSVRTPMTADVISTAGLSGQVIALARNLGHQRAIAVGLAYVAANFQAETVIVMDSDGEDTPESVPALIQALKGGEVDAVVAERRKRSETLGFRAFYIVYRQLFRLMTGREIRFGNFTALSMRAVKRLAAMQELWVHFAASLMVSKLRIGKAPTDRGKRYAGRSQMNLTSLVLHGLRSIMVFAEDVLVRVGLACAALGISATALLLTSFVLKSLGFATPGWASTVWGLLVLIVMQAGGLTFTTLMISGLIRSAPPITQTTLEHLIDHIERTPDLAAPVKSVS